MKKAAKPKKLRPACPRCGGLGGFRESRLSSGVVLCLKCGWHFQSEKVLR
jgi:ribosomal protein L37AE/L43A